MKFGGTSVATPEGRQSIAERVTESLELGIAPVVVVSAMGRKGAPYATDTLLGLVADLPADQRERDLLASTGETISAVVVAHGLRAAGIAARAMTGAEAGIGTDTVHENASITEIHPALLLNAIAAGQVPVVAGFQGISDDGSITTLGRGGSDTTACALGVALEAQTVEIYTDVDGVMTADPRACEGASVLEVIGADELFQMARHGSRVVHTPAAELALASGLGLRVRNTYTDHAGTQVADISSYRPSSLATAVSNTSGIARIQVQLPAAEGAAEHMAAQAHVYRAMADASISLDMFTPACDSLLFTVAESDLDRACAIIGTLGLPYEARTGLAKVTLVGAGMHGVPGVMARVAESLAAAGVAVLQTADSHTTISVLIPAADAQTAVGALHEGFSLGE
ncbi:MAG: aspartate kinase [Coriobacteriia bacterium]|nr:aspartate kinase [Coriobacteriia bacterium]